MGMDICWIALGTLLSIKFIERFFRGIFSRMTYESIEQIDTKNIPVKRGI